MARSLIAFSPRCCCLNKSGCPRRICSVSSEASQYSWWKLTSSVARKIDGIRYASQQVLGNMYLNTTYRVLPKRPCPIWYRTGSLTSLLEKVPRREETHLKRSPLKWWYALIILPIYPFSIKILRTQNPQLNLYRWIECGALCMRKIYLYNTYAHE